MNKSDPGLGLAGTSNPLLGRAAGLQLQGSRHPSEVFLDPASERKRTDGGVEMDQLGNHLGPGGTAIQESLQRRARLIVEATAGCTGVDAADPFHDRLKAVCEWPGHGIEVDQPLQLLDRVQPVVSEQAPDEIAVLLLDVGVVVVVVRAAAAEKDVTAQAVIDEMVVKEFVAGVNVQAEELEGKAAADPGHGIENRALAFAH